MSQPKIALCLIVKASDASEAPLLANALSSVNGYVDEIFVQLNAPKGKKINSQVRQVAEQYTDKIETYEWKGNFVNARAANFAQVPKEFDWIVWMDADDTIQNPEQIANSASLMPRDVNGVFILYEYSHDDHGNVITSLWNCRMVRNNDSFVWKSSIDDDEVSVHETLNSKIATRSVGNDDWKVIHHASGEKQEDSLVRNIELLEGMYERQAKKGEVDPRILFYLASHYYDGYNFKQAKALLIEYLEVSGWDEERSEAHVYIGKILKNDGNKSQARTAFLMALGENPDNVQAYIQLAKLEYEAKRYNAADKWLQKAITIKAQVMKITQHKSEYELYFLLSQNLVNIGGKKLDDALKYANKALKLRPFSDEAKVNRDYVEDLVKYRDNMKAAFRLIKQTEEEKGDVLALLDALPKELNDALPVIEARQKHTPPKVWPRKSIAIYVGQSPLGIWGPWSLNEGGTGGSEEAVIRLSKQLTKLGWQVTVYGMPGERAGVYDGVDWRQYWEMNAADTFDVLISWRAAHFFDYKFKARKRYLWLHDIVPKDEFTPERIRNFDRAIFVSQYHADRPEFVKIPDSKKFVSSNGITPEDFVKYDNTFERDPHKLIYMSANERGLRILYEIWADIKKAVPDATLDIYYGWESFDAINRDNPQMMAWKAWMQEQAKQQGITEHGRIGQDDLNQEIFKSGIFAYPCTFPEVNCITIQKAMAGGAVPVTSDFSVMPSLNKYGEVVPMNQFEDKDIERYKKLLISWLKFPNKQEHVRKDMMAWARQEFDWKNTAKQWDKDMK